MIERNPPHIHHVEQYHFHVFLAGSIEQNKAEKWQQKIMFRLHDKDIYCFNPRRQDYNIEEKQEMINPYFHQQVIWEMEYIKKSDLVIFYFQADTLSPISIGELYYCAALNKKCIVYCPEGFWRKGNVDIVCSMHRIPQVKTIDELTSFIEQEYYKHKIENYIK